MDIILAVIATALASAVVCIVRDRARWRLMKNTPLLGVVLPPEKEEKK